MSDSASNERVPNFQSAVTKFNSRIRRGDRQKWMNCIYSYYKNVEQIDLDQDERKNFYTTANDTVVKSMCIKLCMEAINRDYCTWVLTGQEGRMAHELYQKLL